MVDAFADCMTLGAMGRAMWWGGSVAVQVCLAAPGGGACDGGERCGGVDRWRWVCLAARGAERVCVHRTMRCEIEITTSPGGRRN